ncbi:MAG: hypothetical protein J2P28_06435 [Actinobacteria bacterium]|nr:hypothetical protein [Actinomycetota bacterium]
MFALIAAILFGLAFLITAAAITTTNAVFSANALVFLGLALLAFHFTGRGPALPAKGRRRR